jgi:hypothetical protein
MTPLYIFLGTCEYGYTSRFCLQVAGKITDLVAACYYDKQRVASGLDSVEGERLLWIMEA